jgi:hypothetical protein
MSLLADDECRACFHVHPYGRCIQLTEDPSPNGPVWSICQCNIYIDLEAESRIIVKGDTE